MTGMAKAKDGGGGAAPKGGRSGTSLGVTYVDADIRAALDAFIRTHNQSDEHPASLRSCVEAALKMYLREKGFWPPKQT